MKLKIAFFTLISLPVWSSELPIRPPSPTYQMPNEATILAILNSNNASSTFKNPEHNKSIAQALADQKKSRNAILICIAETTASRNVVQISLKTSHIIDGANFAENNKNFRQEYLPKK